MNHGLPLNWREAPRVIIYVNITEPYILNLSSIYFYSALETLGVSKVFDPMDAGLDAMVRRVRMGLRPAHIDSVFHKVCVQGFV